MIGCMIIIFSKGVDVLILIDEIIGIFVSVLNLLEFKIWVDDWEIMLSVEDMVVLTDYKVFYGGDLDDGMLIVWIVLMEIIGWIVQDGTIEGFGVDTDLTELC